MARVYTSSVINARSDRVWARIRDFNGLPNWHPAIAESRIEGGEPADKIGCVRDFRLRNGDRIFPAMFEAIESATSTVDFLTFVYWQGSIGREMAALLAERAAAGVRVRVILDALGAFREDGEVGAWGEIHAVRRIRTHECETVVGDELGVHDLVLRARRALAGRRRLGRFLEAHQHLHFGAEHPAVELERFLGAACSAMIGPMELLPRLERVGLVPDDPHPKPELADPPQASFDWSMPPRYGLDRVGYNDAKGPFIEETLRLAEQWAGRTGWSP